MGKNLESTIEKCEDDKMTKDSQIRTLREEIAHQEDMIAKLGKDKKSTGESRQKTEEDIQAMEDRCNHLSKVKGKLEQSLDECEDALEREKKSKGDVEKMKRKVEGDLKLTQEAVSDLERVRSELQQTLMRKEKELSSVGAKIEDEHTLISLAMEAAPSMNLTNSAGGSRSGRRSSRLLLRRPRVLSRLRRTTWPSSARPSRSLRRLRTAPRWPRPGLTPDPSKKLRPQEDDPGPDDTDSRNIACWKYLMRHGSHQISLYECVFRSDFLVQI